MTPHNLKLPPKYSGNEPMPDNLMQDSFCILPGVAIPMQQLTRSMRFVQIRQSCLKNMSPRSVRQAA